jgi:putative transposase
MRVSARPTQRTGGDVDREHHYHAVIYDRAGRYSEFIEHFHKLMARSQNALRGRWENFWSSEQTCVVKLVGRDAVIDKLVYTAANPVLDHLVERVHHWPGVNNFTALLVGRPLRATRPLHFFRSAGPMPDALQMPLTIPPELGPAAAVLCELRERVRAVELERAAERLRTGRRVLGRRAVLAQPWRDHPANCEPRRNLRPRVATRSKWARIEALLRNRAFAVEYADARARWLDGIPPPRYLLASTVRIGASIRDMILPAPGVLTTDKSNRGTRRRCRWCAYMIAPGSVALLENRSSTVMANHSPWSRR